jgi:hypothetical protein
MLTEVLCIPNGVYWTSKTLCSGEQRRLPDALELLDRGGLFETPEAAAGRILLKE